jgi:small subunit ribosomal protein S1
LFGTFDENGEYHPRAITEDDVGAGLDDAYNATLVTVEDGQIVEGRVVKIDRDEVLLDIGYKSEGPWTPDLRPSPVPQLSLTQIPRPGA